MVTYADVAQRHALYVAAVFSTVVTAQYTVFLTCILTVELVCICYHMRTPPFFTILASTCTPLATSVCVKLSHHTWWYAHGMDLLGFPPWLMPMHGLLAHWVLDAYWFVTLTDVRKATLP